MKKFILSVDQGTTGTTSLLIDSESFEIVAKVNQEFSQIFPTPGHVEHNLNEIWDSVENTIESVLKKANIQAKQIISIGITNQRETTCAFDLEGNPLSNAIVWQDKRTANFCIENNDQYQKKLQKLTGLPLDPYFSATKMNWLLNNNENVKEAKDTNELRFGTIDTFLLYKMTNGKSFYTEASNASRTLLMDLDSCDWSSELLQFFGVDKNLLPKIQDSFSTFGSTSSMKSLPDGIPITCILGDQQAALFGQAGHRAGELKCTYGTGAFILLNTGKEKVYSSSGLLTTVAYKHKGAPIYALEGSSFIAGAAVQWLRDNLKITKSSSEIEPLANTASDLSELEELFFFPFFSGIGSPYWEPNVKGTIMGLTRGTENKHIARVCLEGIALAINDSIQALIKDFPNKVEEIKVDGGACANNLLMQLQSNFSQKTIIRPKVIETTAYGVALGALIGLDLLTFEKIDDVWKKDCSFEPTNENYYSKKGTLWSQIIETKLIR